MAGFYQFLRGIPGKLGVGVADAGFCRSNTLPVYSVYRPELMVRRSLGPCEGAYAMLSPDVPVVSPLGLTGISPHGVPLLQQLAQKGGGNNGG